MFKRLFRLSSIALVSAMVAFTSHAATVNLPKVEILGKNYYVYQAKKGDSLFGISRQFGWDYTMLQNLNPKATSPLTKGTKVYYPAPEVSDVSGMEDDITNNSLSSPVLEHKVKRGDTLYAISRMYGVPVDKLADLNPGSRDGIKEGETLIIRNDGYKNSERSGASGFYKIKRGDTLYSVAKRNNTTVAAIMKTNPGISESNFKADELIRLPEPGTGIKKVETTVEEERLSAIESYKVDKNDTWETISQKTGVDVQEIKDLNKDAGDKPKKKTLISIPKIDMVKVDTVLIDNDPRELSEEGIKEIYEDVHGIDDSISIQGVNVALLLSEPVAKKDLEFTRGVMSGLDLLKNKNADVRLTVLDGNRASTDVLTDLSELHPDIVFLTTEKGIPSYLSEYAEISQTPMVNTFDVRNDLFNSNPYIIQLLTPSQYFNDEIAASLAQNYSDYTLIFVGGNDSSDQIAQAIREKWIPGKIKTLSIDGLKQANFKPDGKFIFYAYPVKKEDISEITDIITDIRQKYPMADMVTVGRPNWIVYDDSLDEKFYSANVMIPSRFFYDENSPEAQIFNRHYKYLFDREPAKSYPTYAAVGYDCALYFIPQLSLANGDLNRFGRSSGGSQNDYELHRPANWSGLVNPIVYLVRFTPYGTIEKNIVK